MPLRLQLVRPVARASLLVARRFFFFGERLVPDILTQSQSRVRRLGFTFGHFAALVQVLLNKRVIGGFFFHLFHGVMLGSPRPVFNRLNRTNRLVLLR